MFRSDEGVSSSLTLWGTLLLSVIIFKRSRALMFWPIKRSISGDHHSDAKQTSSKSALSNAEKLSGYHDLAKEALERAYSRDAAGDTATAAKLYQTAINVLDEGLSLQVIGSGLGPAHSNVAKWRYDMQQWHQGAQSRLRALSSATSSTSAPSPIVSVKQAQQAPARPVLARTQTQPSRGYATPAAHARPMQAAAGGKPSKEDSRIREVIMAEVLDMRPSVRWEDVAGLNSAKQALREMVILPTLRADLFQGLRAPARGLLLYGPPGNGKTLLAKALAHEAQATFFNISASSLTSKWHGEAEKLVRTLFAVAAELQPSIIFIDEIDSILSERSAGEHEASRRLKTQFLVEFDGVARGSERIVVIGATNRPQELDDAVRRRLVRRIYIPMPDAGTRRALLKATLAGQPAKLTRADYERIVSYTDGYSGSDLAALCREAAMAPIRELGEAVSTVKADKVRKINLEDIENALSVIRPSVNRRQLAVYENWTQEYGSM